MRVDKTSTNMNMHVSGGKNEKIGDLTALQMEKATVQEFRREKSKARNKMIWCCLTFGWCCGLGFLLMPKYYRQYKEADEYIKRAKAL